MKFKVGDRVKSVSDEDIDIKIGSIFTVLGVDEDLIIFNDLGGDRRRRFSKDYTLVKGGSVKTDKPQKLTWAVKYDKDVDPTEYFETKKEAIERIEELVKESVVSNIFLYHIDKSWTVKTPIKFELEEVK